MSRVEGDAGAATAAARGQGRVRRSNAAISDRSGESRRQRWRQRILFGRVNAENLATFCRQFGTYLHAGVSLNRSLEGLRRQYRATAMGPVIGRLLQAVRRGETLSDAVAADASAFDHLFRSMIRVAEVRGGIPETLRVLSDHYHARRRLAEQARSALIYPAIVIVMALAVGGLFTIVVLPKLVGIMQDLIKFRKVVLPLPTRLLFAFSDFVRAGGWWAIPLVVVGTVVVTMAAYRTRRGKALMDAVAFRLPVLGTLLVKIDTTRFAKALSALLDGGVDIGMSLELTADILILTPLRRGVLRARDAVVEGVPLSEALDATRRFPVDLIAFLESGEETGRLPEMLATIADDYEEQVDTLVKNLSNILQPLLFLFVGGIVFAIVVAFFMGYTAVLSALAYH